MEESLKNEIIGWSYEKLITEVFHHSRAHLHVALDLTTLLLNHNLNEEQQKITLELRKNLEKVKFQFEILQTWANYNIKKE